MTDRSAQAACPVCEGIPFVAIRPWLRRCAVCGLWASALAGELPDQARQLAEERREAGLRAVRQENFGRILDLLAQNGGLEHARLLEVGSGHGWFLECAVRRGAVATGIEPDTEVAANAVAAGLDVRQSYFPAAVQEGETFDIVAFNDVFEHLADPRGTLRACVRLLRPGGRLVLNLPDSDGVLYRIACRLARVGVGAPLERLWQARFRFPHLWYFNAETLQRLATRCGFQLLHSEGLPAFRRGGLWARLRMDRTAGWFRSAVSFVALQALAPVLMRTSPDILLQIYRQSREGQSPRFAANLSQRPPNPEP